MSLSNILLPPPTAALASGSAEVRKEKPRLLTLRSFPGGSAQPLPLAKLGLVTGRPGSALPCAALLQLSLLAVPPRAEPGGFGEKLEGRRVEVATGAWGEKLQQPVGYIWGGGTAGSQQQGVGGGSWDGSQPVQRSLYTQGHDAGPGDLQGTGCSPASSSVSRAQAAVGVTGRSWCKERSPSRAGCSSWMASQRYLLLPLGGEISNKGKQRKSCRVPPAASLPVKPR